MNSDEVRQKYNLQAIVAKDRVCLYCDKEFQSESNGNRICKLCRKKVRKNRYKDIYVEEHKKLE